MSACILFEPAERLTIFVQLKERVESEIALPFFLCANLKMLPESTEENAPLFQLRMTGTTFVSGVDIGSVNLLKVDFQQIYTLFFLSNKVHNLLIIHQILFLLLL